MKIVIDIWGGHHSQDHVARYIRDFDAAWEITREELRRGFLVNLRTDATFGPDNDFDTRGTRWKQ